MVIGHSKLVAYKSQAKNYGFLPVCFLWCSRQEKVNSPPQVKKIPYAFALIVILGRKYSALTGLY
jgi:hypothetical protein